MLEVDKMGDQIAVNGMGSLRKYDLINPFIPNAHVLHPTKTENLKLF